MIKVAFFDAKAYDKPSFEYYGSEHDMQFRFLETKLNEDTVDLARGCDAVCVFVNDTVNAAVIDKLYAMGVKLIALRSAGYPVLKMTASAITNCAIAAAISNAAKKNGKKSAFEEDRFHAA